MTGRRAAAILAAMIMALVMAAPAAADDQSVYNAYTARTEEAAAIDARLRRAVERLERTGRAGRMLAAIRDYRRLLDEVRTAVEAEQPSSAPGTRARELCLVTLSEIRTSLGHLRRAWRAAKRGNTRRMNRYLRRAIELSNDATRHEQRALRRFREAGIDTG